MTAKPEAPAPFLGAWTLPSYELLPASGVIQKPLGDHPVGRILYREYGHWRRK